jgi:hypothetical protein
MADWEMGWDSQLNDPRWFHLCRLVQERANGKCELCGKLTFDIESHHKKYIGTHAWEYPLSELLGLCRCCHEKQTVICNKLKEEEKLYLSELKRTPIAYEKWRNERKLLQDSYKKIAKEEQEETDKIVLFKAIPMANSPKPEFVSCPDECDIHISTYNPPELLEKLDKQKKKPSSDLAKNNIHITLTDEIGTIFEEMHTFAQKRLGEMKKSHIGTLMIKYCYANMKKVFKRKFL